MRHREAGAVSHDKESYRRENHEWNLIGHDAPFDFDRGDHGCNAYYDKDIKYIAADYIAYSHFRAAVEG